MFPKFFGVYQKNWGRAFFGKGRSFQNKRRKVIGQNLLSVKLKMEQSGFLNSKPEENLLFLVGDICDDEFKCSKSQLEAAENEFFQQ